MLGDPDNESVFDRLWSALVDRFDFVAPVWIIRRPETLTIVDYRPTLFMSFTAAGFLFFVVVFITLILNLPIGLDSFGLWAIGILALICLVLSFRGTIRETYHFSQETDSYVFVRQFIYRKEVIEGAISQFTGAYVKTEIDYHEGNNTETHLVMLKQEGMFLTGATEQALREEVPIFNSFNNEARIANAISGFLGSKLRGG